MIGRTNATTHITTGGWIRPPEWLQIDHLITDGEQKTVGLYAVWDDDNVIDNRYNNYCCFQITGNYTVDWGDGSAPENFASNAIAEHTYTYASISESTIYDGYKQVIITITPQVGSNITAYDFGVKHSADIYYYSSSNWLDMYVSGTHISYLAFWNLNKALFLKKFKAYQSTSAAMSMANMFANCSSLQSIDLSSFNTSNVTNMSSMFANCSSLQSIDLSSFDTSNVTNMSYMFNNNTSLQSIDLSSFDTSKVTNMSYMFNYCYSLQSIDLSSFNTSNVTNMSYMFNGCYSLQSIDLSQTTLASVTNNTNITFNLYTMSLCRLPNISKSFSVENSNMDAANINALFTDLKDLTGLAQQTINVKGNPGAATCTTSIATDKNWIVITA
jgi:surface protein